MKKKLEMRPREFSRKMQALADLFAPLVNRMLHDPDVVFARPDSLAHEAWYSSGSSRRNNTRTKPFSPRCISSE